MYFGENSKFCTHTETLFPNGQQHPKKVFFSERMSETLERALLVEYACQIKSLSHMVKKIIVNVDVDTRQTGQK